MPCQQLLQVSTEQKCIQPPAGSALRSENTTQTLILFTVDTVDFLFQPPPGPRAVSAIDTVTNGPAVQTNSTAEAHRAHESGSSAEVCVVCSAADVQTGSPPKKTTGKKPSKPAQTNVSQASLIVQIHLWGSVPVTYGVLSANWVFTSGAVGKTPQTPREEVNYSGRSIVYPSCTNYSCGTSYFWSPFASRSSSHFSHR